MIKLTTVDIDDFYSHLLRGGGRDGRPLSPGTVHRVHVVLHRALVQAVLWDWIWLNPASTATPPRPEPTDIRPPSVGDVVRLLDHVAVGDQALFTYLRLAALTGARRSQLLALRWSAVDFARAALSFTRALVEGPDGPRLQPPRPAGATGSASTPSPASSSPTTATPPRPGRKRSERSYAGGVSCSARIR